LAEQALLDDVVEVLWAGPLPVMKHHDEQPNSAPVCLPRRSAAIRSRSSAGIQSRFRLADLARMRIATLGEVPTPWLCLQEDLRQAGIDPARLNRIGDRCMAENLNAFKRGTDRGSSVFRTRRRRSLGLGQGPPMVRSEHAAVSYTVFVTTRDRLVRDAEPLLRMVRAIQRTLHWIYTQSAQEIAAAISSFFPSISVC
jgi:NitT/TauT family transport system substrate-binding protein